MNIEKQTDSESAATPELCGMPLGEEPQNLHCTRSLHDGVHAFVHEGFDYVSLYQADDPKVRDYEHCWTCFELITDANRATGPCSGNYCKDHVGPAQARYRARNGCKVCGYDGPHEMRNYDLLWGEGDIHCGRCGAYVRMFYRD